MRWAKRNRPQKLPTEIPIKRLPRASYSGDNSYNGFLAAERKKTDQVMQVLRRRGFLKTDTGCALCGTKQRVGFHSEDYFDPFATIQICMPCHMALHLRFKSPRRWFDRLSQFATSSCIADFAALPMQPVDFATWLRHNTEGPHDVVKSVWPDRVVPDFVPRPKFQC